MIKNIEQKIYQIADVERIIGVNRLTLRRRWEKNLFPKPKLIGKRLYWRAEDIDKWINSHFNQN